MSRLICTLSHTWGEITVTFAPSTHPPPTWGWSKSSHKPQIYGTCAQVNFDCEYFYLMRHIDKCPTLPYPWGQMFTTFPPIPPHVCPRWGRWGIQLIGALRPPIIMKLVWGYKPLPMEVERAGSLLRLAITVSGHIQLILKSFTYRVQSSTTRTSKFLHLR